MLEQYYKPWELLPEESERIKVQIEDAEALVAREEEEFYRLRAAEHDDTQIDSNMTEDNNADDRKSSERADQDPTHDEVADKSTEPPPQKLASDAEAEADQDVEMKEEEDGVGDKDVDKDGDKNGKKDDYGKEERKTPAEERRDSDTRDKAEDIVKMKEEERKENDERGEGPKEHGDDAADEVLEAGEDTVIY